MTTTRESDQMAAPLDLLLTSGAIGPWRRLAPSSSWWELAKGVVRHPGPSARRLGSLGSELAAIAGGVSTRAPANRDKRFADPAWTGNPLLRRLLQAYLASADTARGLVHDADLGRRDRERMIFVVDNLIEALSPSNSPLLSPETWKAAIDSGGGNLVRGARALAADLAQAPRIPSMVDPDAFTVGEDLACTEGAVVFRSEVLELIQYRPRTEQVRDVPLLVVPPVINKYYVTDLAPGRSLVEHLVDHGQQVFMISWRNPDTRHRAWGADTYCQAILDAMDAVERITGTERAHVLGTCSGGMLASMTAAHLADTGRLHRLAGLSLAVTVLDNSDAGLVSAMVSERTAATAIARSGEKGYLDGRALAEVFAWLRPGDLIWSYWVNNYLLGRTPPPFDVLSWNADTTRMAAAMHRDFLNLAMSNALTTPGGASVLGSPIDLAKVDLPSYVVAGIADHICPWQACYQSTQLLGGESRFVLSTSGHIASIVNPPGNPKATFQVNDDHGADPEAWLRGADTRQGSWWPDLIAWLAERSGELVEAPAELGGAGLRPMEPAPGTYVFDA
ncbi:polyhydroxyalkanoate synthase [Nocardioides sp. BE266]|uniref:PHA/PHB synthase family protein n=1 Tax=Nocardioides sp. BE266 TaxID=2817725 RepID=UPI002857FB7A|nr:alpha/beta fold hydrolase [Nocardioides sp. BE266]MDR7252391.1 polyhydroxyalkanoate synthase [Nocardioides sp. BE266]